MRAAVLLSLALLAACGGGDKKPSPPPDSTVVVVPPRPDTTPTPPVDSQPPAPDSARPPSVAISSVRVELGGGRNHRVVDTIPLCAFLNFPNGAVAQIAADRPLCDSVYQRTVAATYRNQVTAAQQRHADSVCVTWSATKPWVRIKAEPCPGQPPAPPPLAKAECDSPKAEWIWCDDFEQDRSAKYFETPNGNGSFTRLPGVGFNASSGYRQHWTQGQVDGGALHAAFGRTASSYFKPVDAGTKDYREIYWRMYFRNQPGWIGGGGDKITRALMLVSPNFATGAMGHVWSGPSDPAWNVLMLDPASGIDVNGVLVSTKYNDWTNLRWLGQALGTTPVFDAAHVGAWYCLEAHVRLNDAGQSNGVFEIWLNGNREASRTGLNWVGSFTGYGINAVYFENYWNAGAAATQDRYLDNLVISTARIGCL